MLIGLKPTLLPLVPTVGVCFPNSCTQLDVQLLLVNAVSSFYSKIPGVDPKSLLWPATATCTDRHKPDFDAGDITMM